MFNSYKPNGRFIPLDGRPFHDLRFYRQLVGSLIYLTVICPNLADVVHLTSQSMLALTHFHAVICGMSTEHFHGLFFCPEFS